MYSARLINCDEVDAVRKVLYSRPYGNKLKLTDQEIEEICSTLLIRIADGSKKVSVTFNDNNEPLAFSIGTKKNFAAMWIQGLTVLRNDPTDKFFDRTKLAYVAASIETLVKHMESIGYFKYWDISSDRMLNAGKRLLTNYTNVFDRYECYDEGIIPKGQKSGVDWWDIHRRIHPTDDMIIRFYILKQEHRPKLFVYKEGN
jgi:hypothetical protein